MDLQQIIDFPINENFKKYESHIKKSLVERSICRKPRNELYLSANDQKLLEVCKEHISEYSRVLTKENIVTVTHPFYLPLSHRKYIKEAHIPYLTDYLYNMGTLFENPRENFEIVVFDTLHHYAAITGSLLEKGVIDRVILTEAGNGYALDMRDFSRFHQKKVFGCGAYNGRCLTGTLHSLKNRAKEIWAIKNLILNSPQEDAHSLKPYDIFMTTCSTVDESRVIDLNHFFYKMNNSPKHL